MKPGHRNLALLLLGAWPRMAVAAVLAMALWAGYFWAIAPPAGS